MFYEISHERVVSIHRVVEHWMEHMSKDGLCRSGETAIGDILHVVRTGLLVVELPEDDGLDLQAVVGLAFVTRDDSPLISLTTPESTDPEIIHGPSSKERTKKRTRFHASELEMELLRIAKSEATDYYWYQDHESRPAPAELVDLHDRWLRTPSSHSIGNSMISYAHPSLDPEEWEFELDNDFAAILSSRMRTITGISPHQTPLLARLCTICKDFQWRLLDADFAITYATQTLRTNSKAKSCDLCYLLWRTCRDNLGEACESVHFQRAGSTVRMRDMKHPLLTVLRSNGKSNALMLGGSSCTNCHHQYRHLQPRP